MSSINYGITTAGFYAKTQAQVTAEIVAALRSTFGTSVNLNPESFIGQIYQIVSEREALLWQLAEAIYLSQFPSGAEGVSVDNILALNNLKRLIASASVTNPATVTQSNGITLYGLLLFGTAGTVVQAGSSVQTNTNPALSYTLDNTVTIAPSVNGQQTLVFSNPPTVGSYGLTLSDINGNTSDSGDISYLANAAQTLFTMPTTATYQVMVDGVLTPVIAANSPTALVTALNNAGGNVLSQTTSGQVVTLTHGPGYIPAIDPNPTCVQFTTSSGTGTYSLVINGVNTTALTPTSSPAQVQAAIRAAGFPTAYVAATGNTTSYVISFGTRTILFSQIAIGSDTTPAGTFADPPEQYQRPAPSVISSVQACINTSVNTALAAGAQRPYTDVAVSAQGGNFVVSFGATTPLAGQPASGAQPQPAITVARNVMFSNGTNTNLTVNVGATGAAAQAVATATCSETGVLQALAGDISVVGSPVSGWTGVTNQLDTIAGTADEDDTDAISRRSTRLGNDAITPLQGIEDRVAGLSGVTSVVGFENTSLAALQTLVFSAVPTSASFQLVLGGSISTAAISCVPTSDPVTQAVTMHPTADELQAAINALTAYASVKVAGSTTFGFSIDFSGSLGSQSQPLIVAANNNTGVAITSTFGRTPNSFEIVVTGGNNSQIAQAIYASKPAGISSYASPAASTTGSVTFGSAQLTVAAASGITPGLSVFGIGVPSGTSVQSVNGTTVTLSNPAILTIANTPFTFSNTVQVSDQYGNPTLIGFSRPQQILFYVNLNLTTDQYRTPGVPASGINGQSQFQPGSVLQMQDDIVAAGNSVAVGGLVVGAGTGGLIGSFNEVPGIVGYTLGFGTAPNPQSNTNIRLLPTQQALFEVGNISVSYL